MAINPPAFETVPASAEGIAPRRRHPAIHFRGPNLSQRGPIVTRTNKVPVSATTFPFAISLVVNLRSVLRVIGVRGGKAYQERNATRNPSQAKKKTLPCTHI